MTRERSEAIEYVRSLGLNQLEAEVYTYLLPHEPATAYAIGRAIGRPTANVYKAVESLARAGAVLVEAGANRVCRAVPVPEFIRHMQQQFLDRTREAEKALSVLAREDYDERVYRIESVPAALVRASEMLGRAKKVAVVDAFPRALEKLKADIAAAAARGVDIVVQAYEEIAIDGAEVVVVPEGRLSVAAWRSEQLNVVVDGAEYLFALLSDDLSELHQAVWSRSLYLACGHHAGLMSEAMLIKHISELAAAGETKTVEALAKRFFRNSEVPGHRELLRRFAPVQKDAPVQAAAQESGSGRENAAETT